MNDKFFHVSEEVLLTPKNGKEVVTNCYWWKNEEGYLFYDPYGKKRQTFIQCNTQKAVMDHMSTKEPYSQHEIVFLPVAYIDHREYA